jgi:hypothetical protein
LKQARDLLNGLEQEKKAGTVNIAAMPLFEVETNNDKYQEKFEKVQRILSQADINTMTPLQALQFLAKVKEEVEE